MISGRGLPFRMKEKTRMKRVRRNVLAALLAVSAASVVGGCLSIKTEHEIKPIHITMDVNLKVQKELEDFLDVN